MATIRLPSEDAALLIDAAARCGEARALSPADVTDVLDALVGLVHCDVAFWDWFTVSPRLVEHVLIGATRGARPRRAPLGPWLEHLDEHPIMGGRHGPVTMISDVLTGRELEDTWLYQEALVPAGVESEIGLELSHGPDEMSVVVLSRGPGRPFDERDRTVLRLVRPHVDTAFRRMTRPPPHLSPREHEVLLLVRDGLTNGQVARRLGVAEATVAKHLENVFARTGAHNRAQAVAMCAEVLDTPPAGDR